MDTECLAMYNKSLDMLLVDVFNSFSLTRKLQCKQ